MSTKHYDTDMSPAEIETLQARDAEQAVAQQDAAQAERDAQALAAEAEETGQPAVAIQHREVFQVVGVEIAHRLGQVVMFVQSAQRRLHQVVNQHDAVDVLVQHGQQHFFYVQDAGQRAIRPEYGKDFIMPFVIFNNVD